jgi:hypothetical protein
MHAPPRLALLAALGLIALFPSLPLGGSVAAGDVDYGHLYPLNIEPVLPASQPDLELELSIVKPNGEWTGSLATYHPNQPLLLPKIRSSVDVLLRSKDGLWAARELLTQHPSDKTLPLPLKPRGILSGVVVDSDGHPMHCLVQAIATNGTIYTSATSEDGTFRLAWLDEGKYRVMSPLTVHGRCEQDVLAIAGQEVHLRLEPQPTQGPATEIIGQVQSSSGDYREDLRVRIWPMDAEAAPSHANVVWRDSNDGVKGSFSIQATIGEQYVLALEKDDAHPAYFTQAPISAPTEVSIFCEDSSPHADLIVKPMHEGELEAIEPFEVALTWGDQVIWRDSLNGEVVIEGAPVDRPISWMVRSPGSAPAYGELTLKEAALTQKLSPSLEPGWGEGLRLILPDGAPAANVPVYLDGVPAGSTDLEGLLTLKSHKRPTYLSLDAAHLRLFGGGSSTQALDSLTDRDDLGRVLIVLLPRD